ncbi:sporulation phosphorelay system protein KapB [Aneurinibacillus terranovensis]|uniref:sporulation phosphorelay system protein KapB n=1 Tax=Aneurinibacillus terranovensis TaxID=278991 RepID=UPI000426F339|nr:sporulation phosphorelay system protein KapB [Aneurinibacillus terranovensis]
MTDHPFTVGDIIKTGYKSGEYIGEIVSLAPPRATVKILAVIKHPAQGDLHHPHEVHVPLFHQRRALSHQEKIVAPLRALESYSGNIPDYKASLDNAINEEIRLLRGNNDEWSKRALEELEKLKEEYA